VIQEIRNLGVVVAIVTGRRYKSAIDYAEELELDVPLICFNGGMIVDTKRQEIIHQATLPLDYAKRVIKAWVTTGAPTFAYRGTFAKPDVFNQNSSDHPRIKGYFDYEKDAIFTVEDLASTIDFNPLCIKTFGWEKHVASCHKLQLELHHEQASCLRTKGPSETDYLEVYPVAARKSYGLIWLSKHFAIPQEQVLAIGDNLNDLDMLEWAGCGVAMGNALPEVKKAADCLTDACEDDGVGRILEKLLL